MAQKTNTQLSKVNDDQLLESTHRFIKEERRIGIEIIHCLREIQARRLYLARGFSSLFEMCTQEFGYSPAAAQRRIETMRLATEIPAVETKITEGTLSLSVAASLQSFFKSEIKSERTYSIQDKMNLIEICEGKSTREVEKELAKRNPSFHERESVRIVSEHRRVLTLTISDDLELKLNRLKNLFSHVNPSMTYEELIDKMAQITLEKLDPLVKRARKEISKKTKETHDIPEVRYKNCERNLTQDRKESHPTSAGRELFQNEVKDQIQPSVHDQTTKIRNSFPAPETTLVKRKYIPRKVNKRIWLDNGQVGCAFVDSKTGRRCGSSHLLQRDHIKPLSLGGGNDLKNFRLLCAGHNRWVYKEMIRL